MNLQHPQHPASDFSSLIVHWLKLCFHFCPFLYIFKFCYNFLARESKTVFSTQVTHPTSIQWQWYFFFPLFSLFLSEGCTVIGSIILFSVTGLTERRLLNIERNRGLPVKKSIKQVVDSLTILFSSSTKMFHVLKMETI